jgi:hypothetical protein
MNDHPQRPPARFQLRDSFFRRLAQSLRRIVKRERFDLIRLPSEILLVVVRQRFENISASEARSASLNEFVVFFPTQESGEMKNRNLLQISQVAQLSEKTDGEAVHVDLTRTEALKKLAKPCSTINVPIFQDGNNLSIRENPLSVGLRE